MKRKCAAKAVEMIKDGMIVGLGGGSTVGFMIEGIAQSGLQVQAVTPSMDTAELCRQHHIPVLQLSEAARLDLAFDGCDELDAQFNALKSCGGIHTREKLVAAMAEQYILLADDEKYTQTLRYAYPVTVEVLPCARAYVKKQLEEMGAAVMERRCANKAGLTITDDGNYLMEAAFSKRQALKPQFSEKLNEALDQIPGLVGHGLFYHIASGAIIAGSDDVRVLTMK